MRHVCHLAHVWVDTVEGDSIESAVELVRVSLKYVSVE